VQARVETANDLEFLVSELERVVETQRFKRICGPKIWNQTNKVQEIRANAEKGQEKAVEDWGSRGGEVGPSGRQEFLLAEGEAIGEEVLGIKEKSSTRTPRQLFAGVHAGV
jgi:hypothetical protein